MTNAKLKVTKISRMVSIIGIGAQTPQISIVLARSCLCQLILICPRSNNSTSVLAVSPALVGFHQRSFFRFIHTDAFGNKASNKAGGINRIPQWAHNTTLTELSNKAQLRHVNASVHRSSKVTLAVVAKKGRP
jgi:hypothetical protein